jgi:glycosyltransferase involved in cell wall biosynthesis
MNQKTDVSIFVPSLEIGGAELAMLQIAEGLAANGLKVDLVLIEAKGALMSQVSDKVRVVNLASRRTRYSIWKFINYLRKARPAGLISAQDGANVIAILAKFLSRVSTCLIITINSHLSLSFNYNINKDPLNHRFSTRALFWIIKFIYKYADNIVAISSGTADEVARITKIPRERIRVFYLPVLTDRFFKLKSKKISDPSLLAQNVPNILSVGRLTSAKDFTTLIRAFSIVVKQVPSRMVILGEGELRPELESLISNLGLKDVILLPGFVDNCYPYMVECDLFVVSSVTEGLSTVLIEAMACGASLISTDCKSGPREILEDGLWGRLVPVSDYKALAEVIKNVLTNKVPAPTFPDWVLDRFRQDVVVKKYQQLILNKNLIERTTH